MTVVSYRYSNDKVYVQPILNRAADKANILLARADWRADGVVPTRIFDDVFPRWLNQMDSLWKELGMVENTKAEAIRVGISTETNSVVSRALYSNPFHSTNLFYEKSTDNFLGFSRSWHDGTDNQHIVSCIHPDQRGNSYISDFAVISGKAWFLYSGGETLTHFTPKGQTSYYVEDPDIEVYKTRVDRIDPVDYIKTVITKADYTAWMDLPANQADRDDSFTIERYIEV